jgi:WD40 repeat protein
VASNLVWSDDGSLVATGGDEGAVQVYRADGVLLRTAVGHVDRFHSAAFSHDGRLFAAHYDLAGQEHRTTVWDLESGAGLPAHAPDPIAGGYWWLAFLEDGRQLVGFDAVAVTAWDVRTGKRTGGRAFETGATSPLTLSRDGRFAAVALEQHVLLAWPLGTAREVRLDAAADCQDHLGELRFSPDGRVLTMRSRSGRSGSWTVPSFARRSHWNPASDQEVGTMSGDGSLVVRVHADGHADIVDAFTGRTIRALDGTLSMDADTQFSADLRWVAQQGAAPAVWEVATGRRVPL